MPSLIDNDVDTLSPERSRERQYPVTDLVRTYLSQSGTKFFGLGSVRHDEPASTRAQDLWDYLGDFA
jgi:hypothetical protein